MPKLVFKGAALPLVSDLNIDLLPIRVVEVGEGLAAELTVM